MLETKEAGFVNLPKSSLFQDERLNEVAPNP
jgi:hypothetical protein